MLRRIFRTNLKAAAVALLTTTLVTLLELVLPLLTRDAIDIATGAKSGSVPHVVWLMVGVALARYVFQFGRRMVAGWFSIDAQHRLRVQLLGALQRLDGPGQDRVRAGQVVSRAISDLGAIQGALAMVPVAVGNALRLVLILGVLAWLSPPLTAIAVLVIPVVIAVAARSKRRLYDATWAAQQQAAEVATHVEETVTGIRVVKGFAQDEREVRTLEHLGRTLYGLRLRLARVTATFQPATAELPQIALVAVIAAGGLMALRGALTIGTFVAVTTYLTSVTSISRMLTNMVIRMQSAQASADRVFEIIDAPPANTAPAPNRVTPIPDGRLGLRASGLACGPLAGVDLDVAPGEIAAVVGAPASGKTLLLQLATGFYEPERGELALVPERGPAIPYSELDRAALRSKVTCVFDEPFLFSASVRENITMGREASDAAVRAAAQAAQADAFIAELPGGYDEVVGERGLTLSGGQRQRIALARAIFARPEVLLLDDATSAIDAGTEARIYAAIRQLGCTVVAVAHRASTVAMADTVALVHGGGVTAGPRDAVQRLPEYRAIMEAPASRAIPLGRLWPPPTNAGDAPADVAEAASPATSGPLPTAQPPAGRALEDPGALPAPADRLSLPRLLSGVRWRIAGVVALLAISVLAGLTFPTLVRFTIDRGVSAHHPGFIWGAAAVGILVVAVNWLADRASTILAASTGERLLFQLRTLSYRHLLALGMDYFERTRAGAIMTRMTTDVDKLSSFLQTGLAQVIVSGTTLLGIVLTLLLTDLRLAAYALVSIPVIVLATLMFRAYTSRVYRASRDQISEVNAMFQEAVAGLRTTQLHGREAATLDRFARASHRFRTLRIRGHVAVATFFPGIGAVSELTRAGLLAVGAGLVASGRLSAGVLVAFLMYLGQLFSPIQQLSQQFDAYQQARVSLDRIGEFLRERPSLADAGTRPFQEARSKARGPLALRNVTFRYAPEGPVVTRNLTLDIKPGSTVALVGPTGAGKSTVIKLLARWYDPSAGAVTASGVDIREFPAVTWRANLGLVPQEAHLFAGTVAENISYGNPGVAESEIMEAAGSVGALTMIASLDHGFATRIGERGQGLSSGQRQLVALARAALVRPPILLLDEATSTVDPATEESVLRASDRAAAPRTAVIVAHRLATAARADRVLVIDHGEIQESGTHAELLAAGGRYARLWAAATPPNV